MDNLASYNLAILQGTPADNDAVEAVLLQVDNKSTCQCRSCILKAGARDPNPGAIVPYVAKGNVVSCGDSVSQDCI